MRVLIVDDSRSSLAMIGTIVKAATRPSFRHSVNVRYTVDGKTGEILASAPTIDPRQSEGEFSEVESSLAIEAPIHRLASTFFGGGALGIGTFGGGEKSSHNEGFELYVDYDELRNAANDAKELLQRVADAGTPDYGLKDHGGLGHNQPPPDIVIDHKTQADALAALDAITQADTSSDEGRKLIVGAAHSLWDWGRAIWNWLAPKIDRAVDTWLQEVSKLAASPARLAVAWGMVSGQFLALAQYAVQLLEKLG